MKKRSILLTCIVAIMALAMFVGCDSAPVFPDMPQSVKSGYIIQDGDILSGQAFNASKFSVYVVYDNGKSEKIATAAVTLDDATACERRVSVLMGSKAELRREWIDENIDFTLEESYQVSN